MYSVNKMLNFRLGVNIMKKEGKNKFKATIIMMTLVLSTFFVMATMPIVNADNTAPTITNPNPANTATGVVLTPTINATVTDVDGNSSVVDFYYSLSDSPYIWVHLNHQTGKLNVSVSTTATFAISYSTTYWWKMTAYDGHDNTTSAFWWFTTKSQNFPPVFGTPTHANGSSGKLLSFSWVIPINDLEGDLFTWSIKCSNGNSHSHSSQSNGTYSLSISGLAYSTTYTVWVNATDPSGSGLYTRRWYTFTTMAGPYTGSIYVVGDGIKKLYEYSKSNMSLLRSTENCGDDLFAVTYDDTYVYTGSGDTKNMVFQYYRSDLTLKKNTTNYGGRINFVVVDDTYVYAGGAVTNKTYQYWKSNLTKKAETPDYGGIIFGIAIDDTYIYVGGRETNCVYKYWKSDMSFEDSTIEINGDIYYVDIDDTYVYAGGYNGITYQYWKSNLTKRAETLDYGGSIYAITNDDTYVYVAGLGINVTCQYWKSNMSLKQSSASYGNKVWALDDDGAYVYAGGEIINKVYQYRKTDLTKKAESESYGGYIYRLVVTKDWINSDPINSNPNPSNSDTGVSLNLTNRYNHFNITINDANDLTQKMNITWRTNASGIWTTMDTDTNVNNGTYYCTNVSWVDELSHKYWWSVNTSDGQGGWDNDTYYFTTTDNEPPSKVTGLTVTNAKDGKLNLVWDTATDNVAIDHYKIYRDSTFLINRTTTSYQNTGLTNGHSYTYQVSAVDTSGNEGEKSDPKSGTPTASGGGGGGDSTPPTTPTNVRCTTLVNDNMPSFSWTKSTDTSGISGYYIKIDSGTDTWVGNVTSWTSSTVIADGTHTFYVKAKDASSNGNVGSYGSCSFKINTTVTVKPLVADAGGPYSGLTYKEITFDGSKSTDTDGTIVGYRWDWTNDGTYDTDWLTTATTKHVYLVAGKYTVNLQVKDNTGANATDRASVDITENTDDDDDGLSDAIEIQLGSDPNDTSDVTDIEIDGTTYYMVDTDNDGQIDTFYNLGTDKSTAVVLEDGKYKVDTDGDGKTDHLYDPASGETSVYKPDEGFPLIYIVILLVIIIIIIVIAVLYKTGYIYIEKEYKEEEKKK